MSFSTATAKSDEMLLRILEFGARVGCANTKYGGGRFGAYGKGMPTVFCRTPAESAII